MPRPARRCTGKAARRSSWRCGSTSGRSSPPWPSPRPPPQGVAPRQTLLPLPRGEPDAVLLVFEAERAAGQRLLDDVASLGGTPGAEWLSSEDTVAGGRRIAEFLEDSLPAEAWAELEVPREVLAKDFARGLSYVGRGDTQSFCFTGHYGQVLHKASGSLLHLPASGAPELDRANPLASHGAVRFFSPKEILNLLGYPASFRLPPGLSLRHRYKAVGNAVAVTVAATLLQTLLLGEDLGNEAPPCH